LYKNWLPLCYNLGGGFCIPERDIEILTSDPTQVGAVFENGRTKALSWNWERFKEIVPIKDVKDKEQREQWMLENIRVFSDGTLSNPHRKWKSVIDAHLSELKVAAKNTGLSFKLPEESEEKKKFLQETRETENDIKAMMAVSSSARAMEVCSGVFAAYATSMTQQDEQADLNKQDSWAEFLLHKDPEKKHRVLRNPMIRFFYERIIDEAGIKVKFESNKKDPKKLEREIDGKRVKFRDKEGKERDFVKEWWCDIDKERAIRSKLFLYLANSPPYEKDSDRNTEWEKDVRKLYGKNWMWEKKISLNDYISDVLIGEMTEEQKMLCYENGYDDTTMWAAARLACDVFMVDKMTRWSFILTKNITEKKDNPGKYKIEDDKGFSFYAKPSPGWGGDPLLVIVDPSFLPRVVKGVYIDTEEGKSILKRIDRAFRPIDLGSKVEGEIDLNSGVVKEIERVLPCSMTASLKNLARYSNAHYSFLGSSRGANIPQWTKDTIGELPTIAELLDQVYGGIKPEGDENLGRHIMGSVIARILECKAQATVIELQRPGFKEAMSTIFGDIKSRQPFYEVKQFLWGANVDGRSGFLKSLASARTRFIFNGNRFDAEKNLSETWGILTSGDKDSRGREKAKIYNAAGLIMESLSAFSELNKKGR